MKRRVDISAVAAAQRRYRAVQDDPTRAREAAYELRRLPGGECRHCGALNTGAPHPWHSSSCPRVGWERAS